MFQIQTSLQMNGAVIADEYGFGLLGDRGKTQEMPSADINGQMEKGPLKLEGISATGFVEQLLKNTQEGFLADPIYGSNRDMAGWKMIGFPGARYD